MLIDDQDLYHGAALAQIARQPGFTAINVVKVNGVPSRSSFFVNDDVAIYLKYATKTTRGYDEYLFTFSDDHFGEITTLQAKRETCFVVLVCVKERQICALPAKQLHELRKRRKNAVGSAEDTFTLLVVLPERKQFRVYANQPGKKGRMLGSPIIVPRNSFPTVLFE